jgi:hypothetical protein
MVSTPYANSFNGGQAAVVHWQAGSDSKRRLIGFALQN